MSNILVEAIQRNAPDLASLLYRELAEVERSMFQIADNVADPLLSPTASYLVAAGGMRVRPLLTLLSARFGAAPRHDAVTAAVIVELIHMATLCHDDVIDHATVRRGVPSVNARWGPRVAVLTGDQLLSAAALGRLRDRQRTTAETHHGPKAHQQLHGQTAPTQSCPPRDLRLRVPSGPGRGALPAMNRQQNRRRS